jgi:hypothetical protein
MYHKNPLDRAIHRFQHRWETNRQFRAGMSGVFVLLLVVMLCGGVGVLGLAATRALAAVGISVSGSGGPGQYNTNTGIQDNGNGPIYTPTVPTWGPQGIPQATPNPTSPSNVPTATPSPTPTDAATRTPCTSNCGGGGGQTGVNSASWNPPSWTAGQTVDFIVHTATTSGAPAPGVGVAIIYGKWLDEHGQTTDANGNYDSHTQVVSCPHGTNLSVLVETFWSGVRKDASFSVHCA